MYLSCHVYPATDLPGVWVGHCLDLDLVTQGPSENDALLALREAIDLVYEWDKENGLDPLLCRKPAPQEEWLKFPIRHLSRPG